MKRAGLLIMGVAAVVARAQDRACRPLERDRIYAGDLAAVIPAFASAPAEAALAYAPVAGARRVFHAAELRALARRHSIDLATAEDICFEWAMERLDREKILQAMRSSIGVPDARITILETSPQNVPRGRLDFPLSRLGRPASPDGKSPAVWRGDVVYGDGRRFAVWARVNIVVRTAKVRAADKLAPGRPVELQQLLVQNGEGFPAPAVVARSVEQVVGRLPVRPIPPGAEIRLDQLTAPNDVNRGDTVEVEVNSGATRLSLTGRAERSGRTGDVIGVRNPSSNRIFQARVNGKGKVLVLPGVPR